MGRPVEGLLCRAGQRAWRPDRSKRHALGCSPNPSSAGPGTACTETYLVASRFETEAEAANFAGYLRTKFVRFLVSLRTNTQDLYSERFAFVPDLPMDRTWTDADLYSSTA